MGVELLFLRLRRPWRTRGRVATLRKRVANHERRSRGERKRLGLPPLAVRPSLTALRAAEPRAGGSVAFLVRRSGENQELTARHLCKLLLGMFAQFAGREAQHLL